MPDVSESVKALQARYVAPRCVCGRDKRKRQAFCRRCLNALGSSSVRAEKYLLSGELGVEVVAAWKVCLGWLQEQAYVREGVTL